jgi:hypothetical protein
MQFSRELLPQTSATTIDGERGWVCSDTPAHFQPASGPRPSDAARSSAPDARWDDDGGRPAVHDNLRSEALKRIEELELIHLDDVAARRL